MGETILEITGINRTYIDDKDNSVEVLKDINLTLERGNSFPSSAPQAAEKQPYSALLPDWISRKEVRYCLAVR